MRIGLLLLLLIAGCLQQPAPEPKVEAETPPVTESPGQPSPGDGLPPVSIHPNLSWKFTTRGNVYGVALSSTGEYAAVGSWDGKVYLLDKKGGLLWESEMGGGVNDVAMTSKADSIAVLSYTYDETVLHLLDNRGRELWITAMPKLARGVDISEDGSIAVASYSGKAFLVRNGSVVWEYSLDSSAYGAWDAVFTGSSIIVVDDNADVYELSLEGELLRKKNLGKKDYIYGVGTDADGRYVAAVTQANYVYLLKDGKFQWKRQTEFSNYGAAVSPEGNLVAVGSWDGNVYVYDIQGRLLWKHHVGDNVNRLSFSRDGGYLLFGSSDGSAYLFDFG